MMYRGIALLFAFAAVGLPIVERYEYAIFTIALLFVFFGEPLRNSRKCVAAGMVVAATLLVSHILPRAAIDEGHNVYLKSELGTVYQEGLSSAVLAKLDNEFDRQYGLEDPCADDEKCHQRRRYPKEPFAFSADSILHPARYSRVVDHIDFIGLRFLRGGFVNNKRYNWYGKEQGFRREQMPFFVMYEVPPSIVGSTLCWHGVLLWEAVGGGVVERLERDDWDCRMIVSGDVGSRVIGVDFGHQPSLAIRLDLAPQLHLSAAVIDVLKAMAVLAIILLMFDPRLVGERRLVAMIVLGCAGVLVVLEIWGINVIGGWWPYTGGHDGLTHEGYGRFMVLAAMRGDWAEALRGNESVFYFMPGFRYVRALGSVFFGDTSFGLLTVLLAVPAVLYGLFRTVLPVRVSIILIAVFVVVSIFTWFWFSFVAYILLYRSGLGEVLAYPAFFLSITLYLNALNHDADRMIRSTVVANLLFVLAVFIRPNLGLSVAVFLIGYFLFLAARQHRRGLVLSALAFLPAILVPLHNYHYGGVFVPITLAAMHPANLKAPPSLYFAAMEELFRGELGGTNLARIEEHLFRILSISGNKDSWIYTILNAVALVGVAVALAVPRLSTARVRLLATTAVAGLIVLLFWHPNGRYAMPTWTLSYLVSIAVIYQAWLLRRRQPIAVGDHGGSSGTG
jgi:hypothetical protein